MSSKNKPTKPELVEVYTKNEWTYYTELQRLIREGYEVILEGSQAPFNIGGVMSCHLKLRDGD